MRMMHRCIAALSVIFALAGNSWADDPAPNPVMTAIDYFSPDDPQQQPLKLTIESLDINVQLAAGYAETTMVIAFRNPTEDQLEGQFLLDLPHGAFVTGYGLDIEGRIIPGVIVESKKAKKAFEARIRENIDPGLGEVTRENAFKNRVFPIFPGETRRVSVSFTSPISSARPYSLPLNVEAEIDRVEIKVAGAYGSVSLPDGFGETEIQNGGVLAREISLGGALSISPASDDRMGSIQQHPNGQHFVSLTLPEPEAAPIAKSDSVRIYWDTSLSHQDGIDAELAAIRKALTLYNAEHVEIVSFSNGVTGKRLIADSIDDAVSRLKSLRANGATNLEKLFDHEIGKSAVDVCILVTDGRPTLGKLPQKSLPCTLFALSAASDADRAALALLAKNGGGRFVDAAMSDGADLWERPGISIGTIRAGGSSIEDRAEWTSDGDVLRLLAPVDGAVKSVSVQIGGDTVRIPAAKMPDGTMLGAVWAGNHLTTQRAAAASWQSRVALAQEYGVAGEEGSFLVLESIEDYVEQRIDLPSEGFGDDARADYAELLSVALANDEAERSGRLSEVVSAWEEMLEWYRTDHLSLADAKKMQQYEYMAGEESREMMAAPPPPPPPPPAPAMEPEAMIAEAEADEVERQQIVVTGSRVRDTDRDEPASVTLQIREWSPDRPYLSAVKDLCDSDFMDVYLIQRKRYGDLPGFYLEMADAAARCGADFAAEIALSALELPASNVDTMTAVANRLMNFGAHDDAVDLYRRVVAEDAARPQPWRDLALALEIRAMERGTSRAKRRAILSEALDHFAHIIESPWSGAYDGIELISVIEANRVRDRLQAVGGVGDALDRRLRHSMKFDLRVTAAWNVDEADMDLWVDEPTGERTMYSNARSQLGGRLSNDMTNGYGPEEYLIRRAAPGKYEVRMNYYRADIVNPNGAVTLRTHIYRNWGRRNQTMETVDLEFTSDDENEYLVAEIEVEPPRVN